MTLELELACTPLGEYYIERKHQITHLHANYKDFFFISTVEIKLDCAPLGENYIESKHQTSHLLPIIRIPFLFEC